MTIKEIEIQLALGSLTEDMKIALAGNKRASKKILTILSKDKNVWVRWRVANNLNTPTEILTILSTDKDSSIRYLVACNPNTPKEVLVKLSKNKR